MATQPDQLSRSIASVVSRAIERVFDEALSSLPSVPGNSGFATATQEVCNIDVSLLKHGWMMTCVSMRLSNASAETEGRSTGNRWRV